MRKHFDYTNRKEALELLARKWRKLGRRPSFDDIKDDPEMPEPNYYSTQWGSLDKALDNIPSSSRAKKADEGSEEKSKEEKKDEQKAQVHPGGREEVFKIVGYEENKVLHIQFDVRGMKSFLKLKFELK